MLSLAYNSLVENVIYRSMRSLATCNLFIYSAYAVLYSLFLYLALLPFIVIITYFCNLELNFTKSRNRSVNFEIYIADRKSTTCI